MKNWDQNLNYSRWEPYGMESNCRSTDLKKIVPLYFM